MKEKDALSARSLSVESPRVQIHSIWKERKQMGFPAGEHCLGTFSLYPEATKLQGRHCSLAEKSQAIFESDSRTGRPSVSTLIVLFFAGIGTARIRSQRLASRFQKAIV